MQRLTPIKDSCLIAILLLASFGWSPAFGQSGTVEGTITATGGGPIPNATVVVSNREPDNYFFVASGTTDSSGNYSINVPVDAGGSRNVVVEAASPDHAPGRHGYPMPLPCFFNCGQGGEINLADGATQTGLDIALDSGGRLAGTVIASDTGSGLEGATVQVFRQDSIFEYSSHFRATTGSGGSYTTPLAVTPGDYHVIAEPQIGTFPLYADNYVAEAWNDRSCELTRCPIGDTDTVTISAGTTTSAIDFALDPGAAISGDLNPPGVEKLVYLYNAAGQEATFRFIDSAELPETAWAFNGLEGGSYYIQFGPLDRNPYLRELHNGLLCPWGGCERARGSALSVPSGASLTLPARTLTQGGQVDGVIVDAATGGTPSGSPPNADLGSYDVIDSSGTVVGGGRILTDATGAVSLEASAAVPPGSYYVRTFSEFFGDSLGDDGLVTSAQALDGYMDFAYPSTPCAGIDCDLSTASTVSITAGNTTSIIFEITTGSQISGTVVDAATSSPIEETIVRVVDAAGDTLSLTTTDASGDFSFGALPAGSYYVRTSMSSSVGPGHSGYQNAYFDKVHGATGDCSEALCDPTSGTAVTLDGSTDQSLGNLAVNAGPVISGQILEVPSGFPVPRGQVEVYTSSGDFVGAYKIDFIDARYQTTALPPGTYTLVPSVSPAYSSVSTSGGTTPTRPAGSDSSDGFEVTIGTKNVEADLQVVDQAIDRLFNDDFSDSN